MVSSQVTLQKLQGEPEAKLLGNAKVLLRQAGVPFPGDITLVEALNLLAAHHFQNSFQYEYSDSVQPPQSLGGVRPLAKLCGILDHTSGEIEEYIDAVIIGQATLPDAIKSEVKADIVTIARTLIEKESNYRWSFDKYSKSFDVPNGAERTLQMDAIYVYVNAEFAEDSVISAIYYMSVYYEVATELKLSREQLQMKALRTSQDLTRKDVESIPELETALLEYLKSQFQFDYSAVPSDYERGTLTTLVRHHALRYLQDRDDASKAEQVKDFIDNDYFNAVNIENAVLKDLAKTGVAEWVQNVVRGASNGIWAKQIFDHTYQDSRNSTLNAIRANVIIANFVDKATTAKNELVSVTYVYVVGIFYELIPTKTLLIKDVYKELCNTLQGRIENYQPPANPKGDQWELKSMMFQFAKQNFQIEFGSEWAGKDTQVRTDHKLRIPYSAVLDFEVVGDELSEKVIDDHVSLTVFRKDGNEFPWEHSLQGRVFNNLVKQIQSMFNSNNPWNYKKHDAAFEINPGDLDSPLLKQCTIFVYTTVEAAARDVTIKRFIIYYLTVFYGDEGLPAP